MGRKAKVHETGSIIGRHRSWRGEMISMAVALSEEEWQEVTQGYARLWEEAEDDLELRTLTLDERIALFVIRGGGALVF